MQLALDHIVHFVERSPEEAVHEMRKLGFHAVMGGRHVNWGSYNCLSYFDISYIEFLAVEHERIAAESDNPLIRQLVADLPVRGEGLSQIALRTYEIGKLAERLKSFGLRVKGPYPGSRKREDGSVIGWSMLFVEDDGEHPPMPFFIEWEQEDDEKRNDLTERGIIAPHPNGSSRIEFVAYAVRNLDHTAEQWSERLGLAAGKPYKDHGLHAICRKLAVPGGNVLLCEPDGPGITADALQSRGERPFLIRFAGGSGTQSISRLYGSHYERSLSGRPL